MQDPLFKSIYMFHMPLFMAVSGYLSFRGINSAPSLAKYATRRSLLLLLPIFSWTICEQIVTLSLSGQQTSENLILVIARHGLGNLWFLWALTGSIILTAAANIVPRFRALTLAVLFVIVLVLPDRNPIFYLKYTFPFFIAGFYAAFFEINELQFRKSILLTIILTLASCVCFLLWDKNTYIYVTKMALTHDNISNIVLRWLSGGILSAWFLLVLTQSKFLFPGKLKKIFILAGSWSIYIYILQTYVFLLLFSLTKKMFSPISTTFIGDMLSVIIGFCVMCICLWVGTIISKNKYCAFVLFGRARSGSKAHSS